MTTPQTVTAFVIKRSEWLRGEGSARSYLLRGVDKKKCCVGIYGCALGIPDEKLLQKPWPTIGALSSEYGWDVTDTEAEWLRKRRLHNGTFSYSGNLSSINDTHVGMTCSILSDDGKETRIGQMTEALREEHIAIAFAEHGITVTFED